MPFADSEVIIGYGKNLAYSDTSGGTFTNVEGTIDIQLPERELAAEEYTHDDSPSGHKEFTPGLFDPGTATFSYRYTKSQFATLETLFAGKSVKFWKVTIPGGSTAVFKGFIVSHSLPLELEGSPVVEAEIQVNGAMTFTA